MFPWTRNPEHWRKNAKGIPIYIDEQCLWNKTIDKLRKKGEKISFKKTLYEFEKELNKETKSIVESNEKEHEKRKKSLNKSLLRDKRDYFEKVHLTERERKDNLDYKANQIINQSSILISIITITISIFAKQLVSNEYLKTHEYVMYIAFFVFGFSLPIYFLLKSLNESFDMLKPRPYKRPVTQPFFEQKQELGLKKFLINQISVYHESFETNRKINSIRSKIIEDSYDRFIKGIKLFVYSVMALILTIITL